MQIGEFQELMRKTYFERDAARGAGRTFMWFVEEVGELATALREEGREEQEAEFADVLAWLCTLANIAGVDMERAVRKYEKGCPGCEKIPCTCQEKAGQGIG